MALVFLQLNLETSFLNCNCYKRSLKYIDKVGQWNSSSNKCKWKVFSDDATYMFVVGVVGTLVILFDSISTNQNSRIQGSKM